MTREARVALAAITVCGALSVSCVRQPAPNPNVIVATRRTARPTSTRGLEPTTPPRSCTISSSTPLADLHFLKDVARVPATITN